MLDNVAANKILGSLYAKVKANRPELALRFLRRAHELHPHDEEVLIEIGQSERRDFQASLTAFLQAETIINRKVKHGHISQQSVPYQLYNNIASVQLKLGHAKEAAEYLIKAFKQANVDEEGIAELEKGNLTSTFDSETATLVYNLARTYEELKKTEEAKRIYVALAKQHPNYIECYLRLAYITNAEGNMEKAILWCKVATEIKPKDTTSWAVMGNLYLKNEAWILAQKTFEHIANNIDKNDIYTSLAMGNIFFGGIRPDLVDDTKTDRHMQYAIQFFERALKNDKNNVYAALNIGAVLAEKGYLTEAKDILQKVRENHANDNDSAISAIPETFINLGHLAMAQKQYMNAAKTYSYCLRKFYNNSNVDLLMFLAKAEFECGKFDEAERVLQKALHLEPNRLVLWFNVAVSRHEHCITILNQKVKTVESAEAAIKLIDAATVLFQFVANASKADSKKSKKGSEKAVIVRKAKQYVETHLKQTRKKAEENVLAAKKEEERKRTLQEQQREAIKLQNEQDALARQEQERKKKEDAEAIIRKAEENKKKLEELQKKWITQRPPEDTPADDDASTPTGKKPKRKKKEEGEKKKRKRKNKDDDEEQGDDETPKKKKRKTPKKKKSSDDEDQAPGSPVEEKPKKKTKRLKKKKASSDEEQEDELTISSPPTRGDYDAEEGEAEVEFGDEKETSTKDEEPKEDAMKVDEEE
jgi:RNA polymerase-associated protein CTR9